MKKKYLLILILILTVGFASINTVLDLKGNVSIGFKEDDFNVEISKIVIDEGNTPVVLSDDKQSFTFTGTGNNKIEYTITNRSYQYDANINLICEPSENIVINQVGEVVAQSKKSETIESNNTGVITCRMDIDKISKTEIAEEMCAYDIGQTWEFNYAGGEQEFVVPCDGEYKIETWGAQGADYNPRNGGYGAYTSGEISLTKSTNLFVYVGEAGDDFSVSRSHGTLSFNGAGGGNYACYKYFNGTGAHNRYGGSATDIRLIDGEWNNFDSLKSRIMVAAGGSSAFPQDAGIPGGGINGLDGRYIGGATQTSSNGPTKGGFGYAAVPPYNGNICNGNDAEGSSSGYYGGGATNLTGALILSVQYSTGSGSSFISGHNGCNAITENSTSSNIVHTGQPNHYSGYIFKNTVMIDGAGYKWTNVKGDYVGMPSHDGLSTMTGNTGHGYAKITYLG